MADLDAKLSVLVSTALAQGERTLEAPEFQHIWTRARAIMTAPRRESRGAAFAWTASTAIAVLLAVGIGIHGLRQANDREAATQALMSELAASLYWQSPSDRLPGLSDRGFLTELPNIPMVDTSPEEWVL
jgi:hypothetical protein